MTDLIRRVDAPATLTRREFTLEAALALLAGCVITISDAACSSSTRPTGAATGLTGAISANHGPSALVTAAQISAGNAVALSIQGTAAPPHTLTLSPTDLTTLRNH